MINPRRVAIAITVLALGGGLVAPVGLRALARFLVVADPLARSDALYVFPGEVPKRASCAAELFREGIASTVVVTGERIRPELEVIGQPLSDAEINARVLAQRGLPPAAIVVRPVGTSTWEDSQALHAWAAEQPQLHRVTAITSPQHTRRARRTLRKVFRDTDIDIRVRPCPAALPSDWWLQEDTVLRVFNEYVKLAYYTVAH